MARMSIDDQALRDPRILRLAKTTGWSRRETLGCLLDVWALCYDRCWHVIPIEDVDATAERDGFHSELISVGLARSHEHGVHIVGAAKRIAYLQITKDAGVKGGLRSGEVRRSKSANRTNDEGSGNLIPIASAVADPSAAASVVADPSVVDETDPSDLKRERRGRPRQRARERAAESPAPKEPVAEGWQTVIDAFTNAYRDAQGTKPSWSSTASRRALPALKALVHEHGAAEVIRRIELVHERPPTWPPGPWTIAMFVEHFDRLVSVERTRTRTTPQQDQMDRQMQRVADLERAAREPHRYDGSRDTCQLCGEPRMHELHPFELGDVDAEDKAPWE